MYKAYQNTRVETSDPLGLILMSYEAVYKSLARAQYAIEHNDLQNEANHTSRAIEGLVELTGSLNMDEGGEVAVNLARLYSYMLNRLHEEMFSGNDKAIAEVMSLISTVREGWLGLQQSQQRPEAQVAATPVRSTGMAMSYAAA